MFNTAYEVGGPACAVKTVEAHDRHPDGPLPRGRLHRLQEAHRRARRRRDHHHQADQRHRQPPEPGAPAPHTLERGAGPRPGPHPARRRRRQRPGPHPAPAGVHEGAASTRSSSVGVFSNPKKLYDLADTATKAITTDSELGSVEQADGLRRAASRASSSGDMHMVTLPVQYDPADPQPRRCRMEPQGRAGLGGAASTTGRSRRRPPRARRATRPTSGGVVAQPTRPRQRRRRRHADGRAHAEPRGRGISGAPPRFWEMRPVLADWYRRPRFTHAQPARATRRPPEPRRHLEARHPPRVRRDPGQLHLWRVVHHP